MAKEVLKDLHKRHIKGTQPDVMVPDKDVLLCHLTNAVRKGLSLNKNKVYVTSRVLKHLYDVRTATIYDFLINNLHTIIKYPDNIHKNKNSKRADYCFHKKLKGAEYIALLEIEERIDLVTALRAKRSYINNFEKIWKWEE